uniref:Endoplasmic reticulum junction formation protein lunapark n=2 Tax=Meloidogyne TaxID=189290 RepID=A0A6V7XHR9_MELEN|nr:unnamed protein product [Meloidogyne enterolobii]CAD2198771.1 unnamed protein product [Meloidogyne enterolobii]
MGNFIRYFRRRKLPSQELDELVQQIKDLEEQLKNLLECKIWFYHCLLFGAFILVSGSCGYFWLHYPSLKWKLFSCSSSIFLCALSFLILRFSSNTIFDWLIQRKQRRLRFFTERKVAIIEDVKENEKFKVAKAIIEKYGSQNEVSQWLGSATSSSPSQTTTKPMTENKNSNYQQGTNQKQNNNNNTPQPLPKLYEIRDPRQTVLRNVGTSPNRRVPIRPFVEESRGSLDRILDFVMGESINNRYALICSNCYTHNGMALREEFKTISYCCYRCNFFNTSKTELNKRSHPLNYSNNNPSTSNKSPPIGALNFTGHTDDSTENEEFEEEFGRKCSLAINGNDESEREDMVTARDK